MQFIHLEDGFRGKGQEEEALAAARKALELDNQNALGRFVVYVHLLHQKDYVEAARAYRQLSKRRGDAAWEGLQDEAAAQGSVSGGLAVTLPSLLNGLIGIGRPCEAYRLVSDGNPPEEMCVLDFDPPFGAPSGFFLAAHAAALAGTGQGLDAPPPAEWPAIRKRTREWLSADLDIGKKQAAALPVLSMNTVGVMGSPSGDGPLLAIAALAARSPGAAAEDRSASHERMNAWLTSPDLAGVRDDERLARLPAEEREQWRKLWGEVRSLRDWTAAGKTPAKP